MISASLAGSPWLAASRARISARQSRMAHLHDAADRADELLPALSLRIEDCDSFARDRVVSPASLPGALDPPTHDPPAFFHAVEQGIQRRDVEGEHAARSRLDELRQLIPVPRFRLEQGEHEELGTAFLEL